MSTPDLLAENTQLRAALAIATISLDEIQAAGLMDQPNTAVTTQTLREVIGAKRNLAREALEQMEAQTGRLPPCQEMQESLSILARLYRSYITLAGANNTAPFQEATRFLIKYGKL